MSALGLNSKDKKSTRDKANISNPKVNRGCAPLTANRISADCVQISLGPSIPYTPFGVYHTGEFNATVAKRLVNCSNKPAVEKFTRLGLYKWYLSGNKPLHAPMLTLWRHMASPGLNVPFSKWLAISRAMYDPLSVDLDMHLRVSWAVLTGIINATITTTITCRCVRRRNVTLTNSNTQLIILTSGGHGCGNIWRQHGSMSWPLPNDDVLTHWWGWSSMLQGVIYARVGNKHWKNIVKKGIRLWQEVWIDIDIFAGSDFDKKFELVIFLPGQHDC